MTTTRIACLALAILLVGAGLHAGTARAEPACVGPCATPVACAPPVCDGYTCECPKPAKAKCPPKYKTLTFDENWKPCLCVPVCNRPDWTDRSKARGLNRCKTIWASVGAQVRVRYEGWGNQRFGAAGDAADDSWGLLRVRAYADLHLGSIFRVYVEGIYADQYTRELGPRAIDRNRGDFLNGFLEAGGNLGGWDSLIRLGRTELLEGKQRLISPLDWANTRRTFDGAMARVKKGKHKLDLFAVQPVRVLPEEDDNWFQDELANIFWGAYYTNKPLTCFAWDLYVLGLSRDDAVYQGVTDPEDRYTVGGRVYGKLGGTRFDYDAELAGQFGTFGNADIVAGMVSVDFGWNPRWGCWDHRFALGFDYATGDGDDSNLGTFNQLYPLGHAYLGFMDYIGRQNNVAGRISWFGHPTDSLTLRADFHAFWRASEDDAVYHAGGGVLRAPVAGEDDLYVGSEIDLSVVYKIDRHWKVTGGYCHFWSGDFIEATGPSEDTNFFWVDAQVTF